MQNKLREAQYDSAYMQFLDTIYEHYESYLSQKAKKVSNRTFSEDYPSKDVLTYEFNNGVYELAYEVIDGEIRSVGLKIYGEKGVYWHS